ncbi:hypothetical protein [Azoarcus olearius]|uniref:hypothetical protein n=1 Tax=Azoarcus sp. (strain BH72) TaxID=418699 RepID=UPI0012EE9F8B|nr:hypothetical protein [Azoarcus olearius]
MDATAVAAALGIPLEDIPLAQQVGTLGPADARTLHGAPLWSARGVSEGGC